MFWTLADSSVTIKSLGGRIVGRRRFGLWCVRFHIPGSPVPYIWWYAQIEGLIVRRDT